MNRSIIFASLLFGSAAQAHVKPGTYTGKDQDGKTCTFTVGEEYFENNQPHPLNERLPVTVSFTEQGLPESKWNVGHPPVVDVEKGLVRFNHDIFQALSATKTGAASVTLLKDAEESPEGHKPVGLVYVDDNYRSRNDSKKITCML